MMHHSNNFLRKRVISLFVLKLYIQIPHAAVIPLAAWVAMLHYTNSWDRGNTFISIFFGVGCTYFGYF